MGVGYGSKCAVSCFPQKFCLLALILFLEKFVLEFDALVVESVKG